MLTCGSNLIKITDPSLLVEVYPLRRTTVAISENTARRLSEISRRHRLVISALATEALEVACDAMDMGFRPRDLRDLIVILKLASFIDPVLLPMDVIEKLVNVASRDEVVFRGLIEEFESLGSRVASIAVSYYGAPSDVEKLLEMISVVSKVSAFKEVKTVRKNGLLEVSVIGSWRSREISVLIEAFIRGVFRTLGFKIRDVYIGVGSLRFDVELPT